MSDLYISTGMDESGDGFCGRCGSRIHYCECGDEEASSVSPYLKQSVRSEREAREDRLQKICNHYSAHRIGRGEAFRQLEQMGIPRWQQIEWCQLWEKTRPTVEVVQPLTRRYAGART